MEESLESLHQAIDSTALASDLQWPNLLVKHSLHHPVCKPHLGVQNMGARFVEKAPKTRGSRKQL